MTTLVLSPPVASPVSRQAIPPETVNRWTHGFGFLLTLPAAAALMSAAAGADGPAYAGMAVFAASLCLLYAASTLSHGFESRPRLRTAFRIADQVCIYLLIAGTFTPFALAHLRTPFGLAQLGAMWLFAAGGIALRVRRRGAMTDSLDVALCLLTGWIPVLSLGEFLTVAGPAGLALVLAGGLLYTGGTALLLNDHRHPYLHGLWHLFTIAGSACHVAFMLIYCAA